MPYVAVIMINSIICTSFLVTFVKIGSPVAAILDFLHLILCQSYLGIKAKPEHIVLSTAYNSW